MRAANVELNAEASQRLLEWMGGTDAQNAALGLLGQEVAQYNLRVQKLRLGERRLLDANVELRRLQREHETHPVTQKITAYFDALNKAARRSNDRR